MKFPKSVMALSAGLVLLTSTATTAETVLSAKARDALLHVVAHEVGHAVMREFDLPILGPEEDLADDFATLWIWTHFPERAEAIIEARAMQHMADGDQPEMYSEYRNADQRAGRALCILYAQDPKKFADMADRNGLEGEEADNCRDFGPEVGRSWRRVMSKYYMPSNARVTEVGFAVDDTAYAQALARDQEFHEMSYQLLASIDWHSRIMLKIAECDGGAYWSRNGRRITICDAYVQRFNEQLR